MTAFADRGTIELSHRAVRLRLRTPFAVARGSIRTAHVVRVAVSMRGATGYGEGTPIPRYGESVESARAFLDAVGPLLGDDPTALEAIEARIGERPGEMAAKAALDAALHDLLGKLERRPVWQMLGLERRGPPTSYTISLGEPAAMARVAEDAQSRFRVLKLKLGAGDGRDVERVGAVRAVTDRPLLVDVNEGWSESEALSTLPALADLGVIIVEQPLPARHAAGAALKAHSQIPIYLDEDCLTARDVAYCAERAHGVNIKLAKAGGIAEARRVALAARDAGLGVMLGCMVESTLGVAAGCQLASLCDHVDLDTNLLLARDPWTGVELIDGVQVPSADPGLGVSRNRWWWWR